MIYKDTDIHFSINSQIKRSIAANIQFSTQDIDTAKLTFSLTKDGIPRADQSSDSREVVHAICRRKQVLR
nr:BppU family phage baseplate upper protein [Bacillus licheniformis]